MRRLVSKYFPLGLVNSSHLQATTSGSKSTNLLIRNGLLWPSSTGMFHFSPALLRSVEKFEAIVDKHMQEIGSLKIRMSSLATKSQLQESGRWDLFGNELISTKVGGKIHCLCPTHEESIGAIIKQYQKQLSHKHLPLKLYQITNKYRDEIRPHFGLLRCREFLMKDLYTFDVDRQSAARTYEEVCRAYDKLFQYFGVEFIKASAVTGAIGGDYSHEYHIPMEIGEDQVNICSETGKAWNAELENQTVSYSVKQVRAMEVGHAFFLGTKYSSVLGSNYMDKNSTATPCEMGCYGIGVTRALSAFLEVLSSEKELRWPLPLAPFKLCIIQAKQGSKEYAKSKLLAEQLYDQTQLTTEFKNEVVIDDRDHQTIGWRVKQAGIFGYPIVIVVGKKADTNVPFIEVIQHGKSKTTTDLPISNVIEYIQSCYKH